MGYSIERAHAGHQEADGDEHGESQIETPEANRRVADPRGQPVHSHAGSLGVDQAEAAGSQGRQDGYHKDHDAHAPGPLRELSVEQNPRALVGDRIVTTEDG